MSGVRSSEQERWPHVHRVIAGAVAGTAAGLLYIGIAAAVSAPTAMPAAVISVAVASITTYWISQSSTRHMRRH